MVRWLRWQCPPDTGLEIRALAVWGRARYLSVTEAPHNTNFHTWMGKKQFCFFQTAETGNRTPDSGVKGSSANHYPRAPAHVATNDWRKWHALLNTPNRGSNWWNEFNADQPLLLCIFCTSTANMIICRLTKLQYVLKTFSQISLARLEVRIIFSLSSRRTAACVYNCM